MSNLLTFMCVISLITVIKSASVNLELIAQSRTDRSLTEIKTSGCGISTKTGSERTKRVVGGTAATRSDWPWMAAVFLENYEEKCGGALISDRHVLTAAHCLQKNSAFLDAENVTVRLGEHDFTTDGANEWDFTVERVHVHENYQRRTSTNDIALIRLSSSIPSGIFKPICLPPTNISVENRMAYATGWGTTGDLGSSNILLEIQIPIWNQSQCAKTYQTYRVGITGDQLCAGDEDGHFDTCQGDSGGPLMIKDSKWTLVGIVSAGIGCARKNKPGIYTRVSSYIPWIRERLFREIRVGCPDGFKTFDEFSCINEYWLEQYKKGQVTWSRVLELRQRKDGLEPTRRNRLECPARYVEYDEFTCITKYVFDRYQSGRFKWDDLIGFASNKATLKFGNKHKIVSAPSVAPRGISHPFRKDESRLKADSISCDKTVASQEGITQVPFDEFHCIAPQYLDGFKTGEFDWYDLINQRFPKII